MQYFSIYGDICTIYLCFHETIFLPSHSLARRLCHHRKKSALNNKQTRQLEVFDKFVYNSSSSGAGSKMLYHPQKIEFFLWKEKSFCFSDTATNSKVFFLSSWSINWVVASNAETLFKEKNYERKTFFFLSSAEKFCVKIIHTTLT